MKKNFSAVISLLLILSFLLVPFSVSAVYVTGDTLIGSSVTDSEIHQLGDGLVYNEYTYTDSKGIVQTCFTMEFNPKTSDFRSYVYNKQASYAYTITDNAEYAQSEGLKVYAAINGDFFSTNTANYGTPGGMYVTDGKLMCATCTSEDWLMAVSPDGSVSVLESKLRYSLDIGGKDYSSSFGYINKRPNDLKNKIYYFDKDCSATDPITDCNEIVCTYSEGGLSVGGTLKATVAEVRSSGGSALSGKNFVLACNSSIDISSVKAGDTVTISVTETNAASKETVENALHLINADYVLVHEGVDRWNGGNGVVEHDGRSDQFAQRSVVGVKPDGTVIYMVCDGRKVKGSGANGYDFTQIVEMMTALGCTEVVNFDGGGSTAAVISEGDGKFNYEFIGEANGRKVANAILIVRDPNADPLPEKTYAPIVDQENTELRNVAINKTYAVTWEGINVPTYLNTTAGDEYCKKMTDGKYRPSCQDADVSAAVPGTGANMTYVIDLGKVRGDIRDVTFKGVSNSGNRGFKEDNVIVYVSDDKVHWSMSVDNDLIKTDKDGVYEYCAKFKEAKSGRYVKIIIGTPQYVIQLDEIEVHAMVDKSEPEEKPAEDPDAPKPADEVPASAVNAALGKSYVLYAKNAVIESYYNANLTADDSTYKLTDGKLGTSGSWNDGFTVGFISGTGQPVDIVMDLGALTENIEFVQVLNMISTGSFGAATNGTVSYSSDGSVFTDASVNKSTETVDNTYYNHLTLQLKEKVSARYIKITMTAPKYLFGMGEVRVFTTSGAPEEPEIVYGDVSGDNEIDAIDAANILKYDAGFGDFTQEQLKAGDVSGDGAVDAIDATLILQYDAGIISEFSVK